MSNSNKDLSNYRLQRAEEELNYSKLGLDNGYCSGSINRSYYSVFYALKAVLAIEGIDFKRHKDVIAYFN